MHDSFCKSLIAKLYGWPAYTYQASPVLRLLRRMSADLVTKLGSPLPTILIDYKELRLLEEVVTIEELCSC